MTCGLTSHILALMAWEMKGDIVWTQYAWLSMMSCYGSFISFLNLKVLLLSLTVRLLPQALVGYFNNSFFFFFYSLILSSVFQFTVNYYFGFHQLKHEELLV